MSAFCAEFLESHKPVAVQLCQGRILSPKQDRLLGHTLKSSVKLSASKHVDTWKASYAVVADKVSRSQTLTEA